MTGMRTGDFVAIRQPDGQYLIRQLSANHLVPVTNHDGLYEEAEAKRRLTTLRPYGDCWIDRGGSLELLQD